jgi:hypothetical protein
MLGVVSIGNSAEPDSDRSLWIWLRWLDRALFGHRFLLG